MTDGEGECANLAAFCAGVLLGPPVPQRAPLTADSWSSDLWDTSLNGFLRLPW